MDTNDQRRLASGQRDGAAREIAAASGFSTIREMARDFGVSMRALRFNEDRGLLHPRRDGAARLYGPRERHDLKSILKGKRLGFTLSEIHDMLNARSEPPPATESQRRAGREEVDIELALPPEQIVAQIGYLERQRKDLDSAIIALRNAHRRMLESAGQGAVA
jgi:DNA-binding transcriptional MerR regulator